MKKDKHITLKLPPEEIVDRYEANPKQFLEAEVIELLSKTKDDKLKLKALKELRKLLNRY